MDGLGQSECEDEDGQTDLGAGDVQRDVDVLQVPIERFDFFYDAMSEGA